MIRLEKRLEPSSATAFITPLLAFILTLIAGGILFALLGKNPFVAIKAIFFEPLFGEFAFYYRPQLLVKAAPLILIATGLAIGFRAGIWNIGAEGQYIMGALFGASAGLYFYPIESPFIFPLMVMAGALGGIVWGLIPALLKTRFHTNEILVSLMLVYIAEHVLASAALGWLKNPDGHGFPGSRNLQQYESAANLEIISGTGIHWGVIAAFIVVALSFIVMKKHITGFHFDLLGQSQRAATYAGVKPGSYTWISFAISGGLAGLAGLFEVAGPAGQITIDFNAGYGFTAIIVAFLGRLHPLGILLAGLLMALTYIGGEIAQTNLSLPAAAIQAFQGMLLFFLLALDIFSRYRVVWTRHPSAPGGAN